MIIIAVVAISFGGVFYFKLNKSNNLFLNKQEKEINNIISKVSKLYLFPEGENPTVATVSDPSALKDQAFFSSSQKGDNVLIFPKLGKAVLYRPSINKIIDIVSVKSN